MKPERRLVNFVRHRSIRSGLVFLSIFLFGTQVQGALITVQFSGLINGTNPIFNAGDTFSGSYTFESTAPTSSLPSDNSIDFVSGAMGSGLPGTGWNLDVVSSTLFGNYSVFGTTGQISLGNDRPLFGDRYVVTLFGFNSSPLPGGLGLNFFQMDLQDGVFAGQDMLAGGSLQTLPNLALASFAGGRFFTTGNSTGCTQCQLSTTRFSADTNPSAVPLPAAAWLFGSALLGLLGVRSSCGRSARDRLLANGNCQP